MTTRRGTDINCWE